VDGDNDDDDDDDTIQYTIHNNGMVEGVLERALAEGAK
jgi:hypothetical protein